MAVGITGHHTSGFWVCVHVAIIKIIQGAHTRDAGVDCKIRSLCVPQGYLAGSGSHAQEVGRCEVRAEHSTQVRRLCDDVMVLDLHVKSM